METTMTDATPRRSPDERLGAITGRWRTTGRVLGDPELPVVGTDIYELRPGGYFLVHYVDVTVGDQEVRAIEVIGEPNGIGGYLARSFDNDGNTEVMQLTIDDGAFRFEGGSEVATAALPADSPTRRVRSLLTVAADRASMHARWERSDDGNSWQPWMEIAFTRSDDVSLR
jgi:hypothetical protein